MVFEQPPLGVMAVLNLGSWRPPEFQASSAAIRGCSLYCYSSLLLFPYLSVCSARDAPPFALSPAFLLRTRVGGQICGQNQCASFWRWLETTVVRLGMRHLAKRRILAKAVRLRLLPQLSPYWHS